MGQRTVEDATTRELPMLSLRATVKPDTVDAEKRTADVVWTTGARVLRGFWEKYHEELSLETKHVRLERLNNGAPFLAAHNGDDLSAVLGVVESARIDGGRGVATVRFAKAEDDPEAERVFRKVQDGILQNISVGYRVHKLEKIEDGADKIPVYRATDWEPYELSVVPMGADDGAGFRAGDGRAPNTCSVVTRREIPMPEKTTPAAAETVERQTTIDEVVQTAREARTRDTVARATADAKARDEATQEERERVDAIRKIVRRSKQSDDLADRLVREGSTIDQARSVVLDLLADDDEGTRVGGPLSIRAGEDESDKMIRGASAWIFERSGLIPMLKQAKEKMPEKFSDVAVDGAEFRGYSLMELARLVLERRGFRTRGLDRMQLVGQAFTQRAAYQTTSDFAVLLENVMFKTLLGAYAITADTWSLFCKTDTVPDFRSSPRYRSGSLTQLDAVNEHGEFKTKAVPDGQKTSISTATKGNILGLSRQVIVNDDMGALTDMSQKLGRAAKMSIEIDVYALLALNTGLGPTMSDSQPFFHSNRANVNGTGSAIGVAGIDADRVVMASQKDISSNDYLDLRPEVLLVPVSLGGQARVINAAQYDVDVVGSVQNKFMQPNKVQGLFRNVVDTPRLSGTRRYLFASPSIAPAIIVAFLEGQGEAPMLETQDGWRVDGVEWKVRLDVKAQVFDPKGAVTNAGT